MGRPAARLADSVVHPVPPVITPGTVGSPTVLIGGKPAGRGLSAAEAAGLLAMMKEAEIAIKKAETATQLSGNDPLVKANEMKEKAAQAKKLADKIMSYAASGTDIHLCLTPLPLPIHGPGVVMNASQTVNINGRPACRSGDIIVEANVLANIIPNYITGGMPTVLIGG